MDPEDESLQMHLLREHSPSPSGSQILYKLLLESLRAKDFKSFRSLVESSLKKQPPAIDINYVFPNRSEETCLDIACRSGLSEFVEFLLEKGANANRVNKSHNRAPVHFATENGHANVLRSLLNEPTINPNLEAGQQTALHMAVRRNDLDCAELLLEKGASPNIPNSKGLTALHLAAMKGQGSMVNLIRQKTRQSLDLDSYRDYNNQTTREVLKKKLPDIPLPPARKRETNVHDLRYYLNANDETNFLKCLKLVKDNDLSNVIEDLLEMAIERNFYEAAVELLDRTKGSACDLNRAANVAIQHGYHEILRELLRLNDELGNDLIINACLELGTPEKRGSNRLECLKLILERNDVDVRCTDSKGNTPLHYAARAGCREAVTLLLERGSYIGHLNNFDVPPIADIPVNTLSGYFDDCLQIKKEGTNEYSIEFNYQCLMPHNVSRSAVLQGENKENFLNHEKREIETLQYIAGNNTLKHLLKHPLLSSFLYLKWRRIRHILYANFIFYVIFYILLNTYILRTTYANVNPISETNETANKTEADDSSQTTFYGSSSLWAVTAIALFFLALREALQLISSPWHYISSFENWLEVTLILLGLVLLNDANPQVGAVAILLSAWELVILIGQHPRMSTGIEMFKTVSLNFIRFLFLYAFLILAFALAFFTLFKDGGDENFPDPGHSLFKTIIMLTGEFDANDIPFLSHPVLSRFVFVLFVFLIAIVLFNLLNGLAVSDTADILGKAELVGLISRIQLVSYVENVTLGTPFLRKSQCCCSFTHGWKWSPLTFLARRMLIFPNYLKDGKLNIKLYDGFETYGTKYYEGCLGKGNSRRWSAMKMDPRIIKQAMDIISRKGHVSENEKIINTLEKLEERLLMIEVTLSTVKQTIENNNLNSTMIDKTEN